jgi:hypothetical protein
VTKEYKHAGDVTRRTYLFTLKIEKQPKKMVRMELPVRCVIVNTVLPFSFRPEVLGLANVLAPCVPLAVLNASSCLIS